MELNPYKVVRIALPTLFLFYSLSWSSLATGRLRRETFGSSDMYLDVVFPSANNLAFTGTVATDRSEQKISGNLIRGPRGLQYIFHTAEGKFVGVLKAPMHGCEPILQYRIENAAKTLRTGSLRAGFCRS